MKALILNGALPGDEGLAQVERALGSALGARGWDSTGILLRDLPIAYCQGCFECWIKTPGICKTRDAAAGVTRAMIGSDLLIFLSAVTFGGYSSELKKALDRSIGLVSPFFKRVGGEVHHHRRYARYPSVLGVGVMGEPDAEEERIFTTLVARNAINLHAPTSAAGVVQRGDSAEQLLAKVAGLVAEVTDEKRGAA